MSDNRLEAGVERSKKRERDRDRDREDGRTRSRDSDRGRDSDREREKLRERVGHRSSKGRDSGEFASKLIFFVLYGTWLHSCLSSLHIPCVSCNVCDNNPLLPDHGSYITKSLLMHRSRENKILHCKFSWKMNMWEFTFDFFQFSVFPSTSLHSTWNSMLVFHRRV